MSSPATLARQGAEVDGMLNPQNLATGPAYQEHTLYPGNRSDAEGPIPEHTASQIQICHVLLKQLGGHLCNAGKPTPIPPKRNVILHHPGLLSS